jgi:hypothetical protein
LLARFVCLLRLFAAKIGNAGGLFVVKAKQGRVASLALVARSWYQVRRVA